MNNSHSADLQAFIHIARERTFFDPSAAIWIGRAPGRLDVMGGISDYSGSLVLQRPIAETTFAAWQPASDNQIRILSVSADSARHDREYAVDMDALAPGGKPVAYDTARSWFRDRPQHQWASYAVGVVLVLMTEHPKSIRGGARILVSSTIPEGKGVASSAAFEAAVLLSAVASSGLDLKPQQLAVMCQKAENLVAGAPCGLMDQMACVMGKSGSLLSMLCQPADLQPFVTIPDDLEFWGLDSGVKHDVGGSDYRSVRTGAFMAQRIMAVEANGPAYYLANVSPADFERDFAPILPEEMSGEEFRLRYTATVDPVTSVDPKQVYKILRPAAHPVYEHHRTRLFRQLLTGSRGEEQRMLLGELMYQSHLSYTACGLGSAGTDRIVQMVRSAGPAQGLYGARISGGGSGGTVVILGRRDAGSAMDQIAAAYETERGYRPYIFSGSAAGAAEFGTRKIQLFDEETLE
jgi:galactokinase